MAASAGSNCTKNAAVARRKDIHLTEQKYITSCQLGASPGFCGTCYSRYHIYRTGDGQLFLKKASERGPWQLNGSMQGPVHRLRLFPSFCGLFSLFLNVAISQRRCCQFECSEQY